MRKKNFVYNSLSSLGYQLSMIICGLILPNLIIRTYGTEVNGLINSITQFLRVVCISEFGMTAVIQTSLYEPLSKKDDKKIGQIVHSSDKFFCKISLALLIYVGILCIAFPNIIKYKYNFDWFYTVSLLLIVSINYFSQYLFAFTNSQLLTADQKAYVYLISDIIAIVFNTLFCAIEMRCGLGIHIVEFTTVIIFLIKPIVTRIYIKNKYNINRKEPYKEEPIKQKWNGVAQHLAYYVFTNTDVIVLTLFSTLVNVSIYSVYVMVLNGLKSVSSMFEQGIRSMLGELWAIEDKEKFYQYFSVYEWFMFATSIFLYGCAISLIVPFVSVYTHNIHDANYILPEFAFFITIAYLILNLRGPYHTLIQSVGHYKQTQISYIFTALINIMISIILVYKIGLVGVAIGTLIGALVEILWQSFYLYRKVLNKSFFNMIKLIFIYSISFVIAFYICDMFNTYVYSYISWFKLALPVSFVWFFVVLLFSLVFYRKNIIQILLIFKKLKT